MIEIILVVIVVGICLWLVNQYVPMAPPFKTILNAIVALLVLLWILSEFGLIGPLPHPR